MTLKPGAVHLPLQGGPGLVRLRLPDSLHCTPQPPSARTMVQVSHKTSGSIGDSHSDLWTPDFPVKFEFQVNGKSKDVLF